MIWDDELVEEGEKHMNICTVLVLNDQKDCFILSAFCSHQKKLLIENCVCINSKKASTINTSSLFARDVLVTKMLLRHIPANTVQKVIKAHNCSSEVIRPILIRNRFTSQ